MTISFLVVVVSDNVYYGVKNDVSGEHAVKLLSEKGFFVTKKIIVPNDPKEIIKALREKDSDVLLFIGGTGPSPRDLTVDVLEKISWRHIPGFGELFRRLSFEEIGYRGIISRAELYVLYDGRIAVALPGSVGAVELGVKIISEIIEHLVQEAKRFSGEHYVPK